MLNHQVIKIHLQKLYIVDCERQSPVCIFRCKTYCCLALIQSKYPELKESWVQMLQMTCYITQKSKINNQEKDTVQTCGMLRSKLREMAPDPQPTSRPRKSVLCDSPCINRRSSRTRLTSSQMHTNQRVQAEINVFKHTVCVYPKSHIYLKSTLSLLQNSDMC